MSITKYILKENRAKRYIQQGWNPDIVNFANEHFKPRDWFEYVLKVIRYGQFFKNKTQEEIQQSKLSRKISKDFGIPEITTNFYVKMITSSSDLLRKTGLFDEIKHYLSFEENQRFRQISTTNSDGTLKEPYELIDELQQWEQERIENLQDKERSLDTGDTIISFEDGWYWVRVDEPYCDQEGQAMGHCGNNADYTHSDTILSLRDANGAPWATFIDKGDGMIGEMKGRHNKRPWHPRKDLNPYIIELLKSDHVNHILGGGYASHENFNFEEDLSTAEQREVLDVKPNLIVTLDLVRDLISKGEYTQAMEILEIKYPNNDATIEEHPEYGAVIMISEDESVIDIVNNSDIEWVDALIEIINKVDSLDEDRYLSDKTDGLEDFIEWIQVNDPPLASKIIDYFANKSNDVIIDGLDASNLYDFIKTNEFTIPYVNLINVYKRMVTELNTPMDNLSDNHIRFFKRILQYTATYYNLSPYYYAYIQDFDDEEKIHIFFDIDAIYDESEENYLSLQRHEISYDEGFGEVDLTVQDAINNAISKTSDEEALKSIQQIYTNVVSDIDDDLSVEEYVDIFSTQLYNKSHEKFDSPEERMAWTLNNIL